MVDHLSRYAGAFCFARQRLQLIGRKKDILLNDGLLGISMPHSALLRPALMWVFEIGLYTSMRQLTESIYGIDIS
tara:strand:+ start:421 stop:645 length:225 start_codon:yes stop_codon:yes gene_type:complete